jgi:hypothetical protein
MGGNYSLQKLAYSKIFNPCCEAHKLKESCHANSGAAA